MTLFAADYPASIPGVYGAGDELLDTISWPIPSFAPLGLYDVSIQTHGANQASDVFACLRATFTISA